MVLLGGCLPTGIGECKRADDGEPAALRRRLEAQEPGGAVRVKQEPVDGPVWSPAPQQTPASLEPSAAAGLEPCAPVWGSQQYYVEPAVVLQRRQS